MRKEVIKKIEDEKLIVIVRGVKSEKLIPLAEAMYKGGIRLLEVTFDASGECSDCETAENIRILCDEFKGKMFIGAGTVLTKKQVELVKKAGGSFIISPNTDKKVIQATKKHGMVSMPGALTPSEIKMAVDFGADFVKLFPVSNFGPGYVKAVKAPLSNVKFTAVGGIDENNMKDYIKVGVSGFGIGTNIVNKKMIEENNYEAITELAARYVDALKL